MIRKLFKFFTTKNHPSHATEVSSIEILLHPDVNDRDNKMALSQIDSGIPQARIRTGRQVVIHLLKDSHAVCGAGHPADFFYKDECWTDNPIRVTCPACIGKFAEWIRSTQESALRFESDSYSDQFN